MPKHEPESTGFAPESLPIATSSGGIPIEDVFLDDVPFSELGENLPTGLFFEGQRLRSYTLHPYTGEMEVSLERLFQTRKQGADKVYSTLRQFLPRAIKDIGGLPLERFDSDPRRTIDRMDLGDIFSIVLGIRYAYQGKGDIAITGQCPRCDTVNEDRGDDSQPYHDLGTVSVKCYRHLPQEPLFDIVLKDGFTVTGEHILKLRMRPLRFYQLKKWQIREREHFQNSVSYRR
ncbi:MAG: hypothetical protein HC786_23810 [Richelia sp. CSU_2_1]|nr:hypothetical protein [Richelia sp. CSU_2_1]